MKTNKKKIIVLVSLVVLLVATGVLNYFLSSKAIPKADDTSSPAFFVSYRQTREVTRSEEILLLDSIILSPSATEDAIAEAQAKKLMICDNMETELILEGLIKAKGFEDCVVTISTENVNVIVKQTEVTLEEAARILDIIVTETSFTAPDVYIIPY